VAGKLIARQNKQVYSMKLIKICDALYDRIKQTAFLTMTTKLMLCMEKWVTCK